MQKILEINDLRKLAKKTVPKMFYDYVDSGSWTQKTYRANEEDFSKIMLRQRVGINIKKRSYKTKALGKEYSLPIGLSPTGMSGMLFPDGEILVAKVCAKRNIPYIISTMTICPMEQIAQNSNADLWFQLYVMKDKEFVENIIGRAKKINCKALVLTMDLPVLGQRHNDIRNGLSTPPKLTIDHILQLIKRPKWCYNMVRAKNKTFGNILGHAKGVKDLKSIVSWTNDQFDQELSWSYVEWIRKLWDGPLIIKGILDEEDAKTACSLDIQGIIVSNHGGRQLDGTISSVKALSKIVDRVGNDTEVFFDGGIRSGQDVIKAISLGARMAFFGRPYLYGLGALGKEGVETVINIIEKEIDLTLALCGKTGIEKLNREALYNAE